MMTSAISSAVEASAFLTTSRVIGSTAAAVSGTDIDLDVAVSVQPGAAPGWDDARRVVLVNEQRPGRSPPSSPARLQTGVWIVPTAAPK